MKRIRGHHLFCMALFSGHGYDRAFSENMARMINLLKAGEPFQLGESQDDICAACPNLEFSGGCVLGTEDVKGRDRSAFQVLGFQSGEEHVWKQAMERLEKISQADFESVCGGCRWKEEGLCSHSLLMRQIKS